MKNKLLLSLIVVTFCTAMSLPVFAETENKIVLSDGRVFTNPYIISRTPSGLNVGHEKGVVFIPFAKMSKERQKQYNYNPKESKKHKKKIAKAQRTRQIRLNKKRKRSTATGSELNYQYASFPEQSPLTQLKNELAELIREKARLERERTRVNSGRVAPRGGSSERYYVSYRGGKVYRKTKSNYGENTTKNFMSKRNRLKAIASALQKNGRRTLTVRNLISRAKGKGIFKGRTL